MSVYVGTAGFSYRDWKGYFYSKNINSRHMLEEYSRHFPLVEINSTYYAIPQPDRMNSMAQRTPPHFLFSVKANREMTHEISGDKKVFTDFLRAVRPLSDHGKLACILVQFPWGFKNTGANQEYLEILAGHLEGIETVVEFRNSQWDHDETFVYLKELGLGYCCVDEPRMKGLMSPRSEVTSDIAYVRFHGRNYKTWWKKDAQSWERYDYLYKPDELDEWLPRVEVMSGQSKSTYIIFNNHYKGQAPTNARMFEEMLRGALGDQVVTTGEADEKLF